MLVRDEFIRRIVGYIPEIINESVKIRMVSSIDQKICSDDQDAQKRIGKREFIDQVPIRNPCDEEEKKDIAAEKGTDEQTIDSKDAFIHSKKEWVRLW